jgi:hypothetical protein
MTTALAFLALCVVCPTLSHAQGSDDALSPAGSDAAPQEAHDAAVPLPRHVEPKHAPETKPVTVPAPAPETKPAIAPAPAFIQIEERHLCTIHVAHAGHSAEERAQRASHVLEQVLEESRLDEVRVGFEGTTAVIYIGNAPVVQLSDEDAVAAGDASVAVHADTCAASIRQGLRTELRRRNIANLAFSISLIVLSGLLAFLLLGTVSRTALRLNTLFEARETVPALTIGNIELLTPAAVRVTVSTTISIAKPIAQIVIVLGWLLSAMSLLPVTEALGRRWTGYVLVPLTTFLSRVGSALPLLVLLAIGAFTLIVLLRFLRVFFDSVAHGGIHLSWLPPERAVPVSVVIRALVVIGTLLAAAPLVTGDNAEWGALRIVGVALTAAIVLALTPPLANVALGTLALYANRLKPDVFIEIGPHSGRLSAITLSELQIIDRAGTTVYVPHLMTLFRELRILGDSLPSHYEIIVDARAPQGPIRKALVDALRRQGRAAQVELTEIEGDRACYRAVGTAAPGEEDLASAIADALTREGVVFSRIRKIELP